LGDFVVGQIEMDAQHEHRPLAGGKAPQQAPCLVELWFASHSLTSAWQRA
jgi:hypothetical protein